MEKTDKDYIQIRKLFEDSLPEMSADRNFINRVETGIKGVDIVKASIESYRRRNRIAAVISGFAGFLCGVILTSLYPFINALIMPGILHIANMTSSVVMLVNIIVWILIAVVCLSVSLGTYPLLIKTRQLHFSGH